MGVEIFFEKDGQQKKVAFILKYGTKPSLHIGVPENFMQSLSVFFVVVVVVVGKKVAFKSSIHKDFYPMIELF